MDVIADSSAHRASNSSRDGEASFQGQQGWNQTLIILYLALCLSQMASAIALYDQLFNWNPQQIAEFYLGASAGLAQPQSNFRLLESLVPHLLSMATISFILLHLLGFVSQRSEQFKTWAAALLFGSFLVKNLSCLFILNLGAAWAYLHIGSFILFESFYFCICIFILKGCLRTAGT